MFWSGHISTWCPQARQLVTERSEVFVLIWALSWNKLRDYLFVRNDSEQITVLITQILVSIKPSNWITIVRKMSQWWTLYVLAICEVLESDALTALPLSQHCACVSTYVRSQRWADKRPPIAWSMIGKMNSFGRLQWKYTLPPPPWHKNGWWEGSRGQHVSGS